MWKYGRDEKLLAGRAKDEVISIIMRLNGLMSYNSEIPGDKSDLSHTVDFLEMCKRNIDEELNRKIKEVKERI